MTKSPGEMDLASFARQLASLGCHRLFAKRLSPNDNSKNQVYLGPGFDALQRLPNRGVRADVRTGRSNFKAALDFSWLTPGGLAAPAPHAVLILYPQYPEVRLSGFLRGSEAAPTALMTSREEGRILFLGTRIDGGIVAHVVGAGSLLAKQFLASRLGADGPMLEEVQLEQSTGRHALVAELARIRSLGWIEGARLGPTGRRPCTARNCAGYTLEAELGIVMNGEAAPDYRGWEVKAIAASGRQAGQSSKPVTLLTPEPDGGYYHQHGARRFVVHYGYADRNGVAGRINFGGRHLAGRTCKSSNLTLRVRGFDAGAGKIVAADGAVQLESSTGDVAASWSFEKVLSHWSKKHAQAAYVAYQVDKTGARRYRYGEAVGFGEGTTPIRFLAALAAGDVYYDPALKVVDSEGESSSKARNQFRVPIRSLGALYEGFEWSEVG